MEDFNQDLNDKRIRDLLKWRLLEQNAEDDLLTQKLTDMEAKIAFGSEALYVPSLQKEKELFEKLNKTGNAKRLYKWIIPAVLLLITAAFILYFSVSKEDASVKVKPGNSTSAEQPQIPGTNSAIVPVTDSTGSSEPPLVLKEEERTANTDTIKTEKEEKWLVADPGIKVEDVPLHSKYDPAAVEAYDHIPVLSEKEKAWTLKYKEMLIKATIKHDKKTWAYIPASTEIINGDTVSVNGFYMLTQEVTNNTYRAFLNDLILNDKTDDFLKAVPDTAKWVSNTLYSEPMQKNYWWHPAYDDYPVVTVTREGAKMFCDWLTITVNNKIKESNPKEKWESLYINDLRIPAEEEWVIAARGGHGDIPYPWSKTSSPQKNSIQNARGCYMCNFSIINYPDSLRKLSECANDKVKHAITSAGTASNDFYCTAKVDSYNPNDYGLYCMSGNVAEMVWQYKTGKPCAKGGSWTSDQDHVKISADPELVNVTEGSPYLGFRPVFTAPKKK